MKAEVLEFYELVKEGLCLKKSRDREGNWMTFLHSLSQTQSGLILDVFSFWMIQRTQHFRF